LARALPADAIVTSDIGNICSVANAYLRFTKPRSFLPALGFGNCGFAYPAALGAKVAAPDRPVVAIIGDGAWGMSLHEVMTAVEEKAAGRRLRLQQPGVGRGEEEPDRLLRRPLCRRDIGHGVGGFNFAEIAQAMGALGVRVTDPANLQDTYKEALAAGTPVVIEIMVDRRSWPSPSGATRCSSPSATSSAMRTSTRAISERRRPDGSFSKRARCVRLPANTTPRYALRLGGRLA